MNEWQRQYKVQAKHQQQDSTIVSHVNKNRFVTHWSMHAKSFWAKKRGRQEENLCYFVSKKWSSPTQVILKALKLSLSWKIILWCTWSSKYCHCTSKMVTFLYEHLSLCEEKQRGTGWTTVSYFATSTSSLLLVGISNCLSCLPCQTQVILVDATLL